MRRRKEKITTLTPLRKLGYESGLGAESVVYNMFYVFFMLFLTTVVGINPALAGTISLISVLVDAITDPLIGWICDRPGCNTKRFMLIGGVMTGILLGASFYVFPGSQAAQFVYYTVVTSLMWVSYTSFCIPYYACCVQMTDDYDEITKIRGISQMMNAFFIYCGAALPTVFVGMYTGLFDEGTCWTMAAFSIGAISIIFGLINYFSIKDVEFIKKPAAEKMEGVIATYVNLLKLKPMKWFIPWVFFILLGTAVATANVEYVIIYTAGLPASVISQTSATTLVCFLVGAPLFTWIATKWDRKNAVIIGYVISIVCLIGVKILGIDSLFDIFLLQGVTGIATVAFWVFFYDFSYDLIELDEYQNRKNRAGAITSFPQLVQKTGNAVGLQLIGIMLSLVGFDAAKGTAQSAQTLVGIENIATFFVAGCMLISLICAIKYPINKGLYEKLQAANEKRRNGDVDFTDPDVDALL